jgi:hypothetical protein
MGPKTLPTIWGIYMKLVTKYQISAINSCWDKCAYMLNVYKSQLSRPTGSRNLMGPLKIILFLTCKIPGLALNNYHSLTQKVNSFVTVYHNSYICIY